MHSLCYWRSGIHFQISYALRELYTRINTAMNRNRVHDVLIISENGVVMG